MNLLITGAWAGAKEHIEEIEKLGHSVCFMQYEKDALPCDPDWVEGVICNGLFLSHPIELFQSLRFIQLTSAGYDRIPMEYVRAHGIEIHNAKGVYSIPMAEFALCGVLQLYKQSAFFRENQKRHIWEKHRGLLELQGKTVLIVGCGDVGRECAKRFKAFDCRVIGVNRTLREAEFFDSVHTLPELDDLLPKADVLVLTIAATEETQHLINAERLQKLSNSAIIVNISRGTIIDTEALTAALPTLGGAVLDVFEEEPLSEDSPLWEMENVIVTPHNSFVGDGNEGRMNEIILFDMEN